MICDGDATGREQSRPSLGKLARNKAGVKLSTMTDSSFPTNVIFAVPSLLLLFLSKKNRPNSQPFWKNSFRRKSKNGKT